MMSRWILENQTLVASQSMTQERVVTREMVSPVISFPELSGAVLRTKLASGNATFGLGSHARVVQSGQGPYRCEGICGMALPKRPKMIDSKVEQFDLFHQRWLKPAPKAKRRCSQSGTSPS